MIVSEVDIHYIMALDYRQMCCGLGSFAFILLLHITSSHFQYMHLCLDLYLFKYANGIFLYWHIVFVYARETEGVALHLSADGFTPSMVLNCDRSCGLATVAVMVSQAIMGVMKWQWPIT